MALEQFRCTRIDKIYYSREEALSKLHFLKRYFGELVAIRYKTVENKTEHIYILLALYKSCDEGDFQLVFDEEVDKKNGRHAYKVTRRAGETDMDAIGRIVESSGIEPKDGYFCIVTRESEKLYYYIYCQNEWVSLTTSFVVKETDGSIDIAIKHLHSGKNIVTASVGTIDCGYLHEQVAEPKKKKNPNKVDDSSSSSSSSKEEGTKKKIK